MQLDLARGWTDGTMCTAAAWGMANFHAFALVSYEVCAEGLHFVYFAVALLWYFTVICGAPFIRVLQYFQHIHNCMCSFEWFCYAYDLELATSRIYLLFSSLVSSIACIFLSLVFHLWYHLLLVFFYLLYFSVMAQSGCWCVNSSKENEGIGCKQRRFVFKKIFLAWYNWGRSENQWGVYRICWS